MTNKIRVALLGLGEVGQTFAEHFLEKIQEHGAPVQIVAVADRNIDSPVALGFSQNGVPVYKDALDVANLGDQVDIIFDLTNNSRLRQELRLKLLETKNKHTLIATEIVARLLWCFFEEKTPLKTTSASY
jgi:homoserine dehydrogenase